MLLTQPLRHLSILNALLAPFPCLHKGAYIPHKRPKSRILGASLVGCGRPYIGMGKWTQVHKDNHKTSLLLAIM